MQAYISSPVGASLLLRGLEEQAGIMTNYCLCLNGTAKGTSAKRIALRLMKTIDGRPTYMTIARHNKQMLVASLENEEGLVKATAKRRLAALLIPLVTEYIGSHDASLTIGGGVRIVFGESANAVAQRKTCLLFAEDVAIHTRPTLRSGKSVSSSGAKFSTAKNPSPKPQQPKVRALN